MPAPLAVDKEQVRMLVVQYGTREAARRCNLNENTVLAWSNRGGWLAHLKPENQPKLPESMQPTVAIGAIKPADAQAEAMKEDSKACKAATLRYGRRTLEAAADLSDEEPIKALAMAPDVASTVKSVALAGEWQQGSQAAAVWVQVAVVNNPPEG